MSMSVKSVCELPENGNGNGNGHGSLESLLEELETDPRVVELLSGVPVIREPCRYPGAGCRVRTAWGAQASTRHPPQCQETNSGSDRESRSRMEMVSGGLSQRRSLFSSIGPCLKVYS